MSRVVAVLVVVPEGDPGKLLAPGATVAGPPALAGLVLGEWSIGWDSATDPRLLDGFALPLWWGGKLVPEGWDRFLRRINTNDADEAPRDADLDCVLRMVYYVLAYQTIALRLVCLAEVDGDLVEVAGPR